MSIDGIGRPPGGSGLGPLSGPSAPTSSGEGFRVERAPDAQGVESTGPLARLERGEISVDQYLDARVEEATAPLAKRLAPEALEFVKSSLRQELSSDPVLVELVRRATAVSPAATEP
jgi:hypothetical protein